MIEQRLAVLSNEKVAENTFLMRLESKEIALAAQPGQFIMLRVREGIDPLLRRPFSIAGVFGDQLLILYRVVGKGTASISEVRRGEVLPVLGPLGSAFGKLRKGETAVLVGGGIGVAPLLFLAQTLPTKDVRFMSGYRSASEQPPLGEFGLLSLKVALASEDGSIGHHGLVTDLLKDFWAGSGGMAHTVYTCGPLPMLKKVAEMCLDRGVPCQTSLETSMACGLGACQGCAVKAAEGGPRPYYHVCHDGPVFLAQTLDWKSL